MIAGLPTLKLISSLTILTLPVISGVNVLAQKTIEVKEPAIALQTIVPQIQSQTVEPTATTAPSNASLESHPRLFLNTTKLSRIRAAIQVAGSTHQAAFSALKERVDRNNWQVYDTNLQDGNWNYARAHQAREAAFLYQLTRDPRYATIAYEALHAVYADPDPDNRTLVTNHGLSRATVGLGFALAYDWASPGWTVAQRQEIRDRIVSSLNAWIRFRHSNLGGDYASNWVAVCRGAELMLMLAVAEEDDRPTRYRELKFWLNRHISKAYGSSGWTQEGLGYKSYAAQYLLPAVYAAQSIGDTDLNASFNAKASWKLAMQTGSFTRDRLFLMSGVDLAGIGDQGWISLLLNSVPPNQLPYYQYFYDHHTGINSGLPLAEAFDPYRAGTVWALLYYPIDSQPINPTEYLDHTLADHQKGAYFFRNRWQDSNDVLVSIMADLQEDDRGWDQAEAFQLGLIAYNTRFIGAPGKEGKASGFSALLVDGNAYGRGTSTGGIDFTQFEPNGNGYVIVDGGQKYAKLGLTQAKRHLLVDFSGNAGSAILSTIDRVQAPITHTYTWQLNLGDPVGNGGVTATSGTEGGLPSFTLRGKNDSYVKGWVLSPSQVTIAAGDPLQITTSARSTSIWVVMVVGSGTPPTAAVSGRGLSSILMVENAWIYYDVRRDRIISKPVGGSGLRGDRHSQFSIPDSIPENDLPHSANQSVNQSVSK